MLASARSFKIALLAAGDLAAAFLALAITLLFRYGPADLELHWLEHRGPFALIFVLWLAILFIVGLYEFEELRSRIELISRTAEALLAAFLVSLATFYLSPWYRITPKTNLVAVVLVYALLFIGWRVLTLHLFAQPRFRLKAVFLGDDPEVRELCDLLNAKPHLGYTCLAALPASGGALPPCDVIVVSHRLRADAALTAGLYRKFFEATAVVDLPTFYERVRHSVPASALDERWILDNLAMQETGVFEHAKRLFDVVFAALFLVPAAALAPFIALAVKVEDRGPVFFRQTRVGRGGKPFAIVKFRTMRVGAEANGAAFASEGDPRVTRVGRFLRTTRLDELPQLWNILRGEMSFVGPRPERPEFEAELSKTIPLFPVRHLVRPGLTGWAQVSAPYAATEADHLNKLRHDLYYLKHRSLALDAAIILKTIYSVIKRKGR